MTDKFNEPAKSSDPNVSFKDQILRDLQEATRLRSQREEELQKSTTMPGGSQRSSSESPAPDASRVSSLLTDLDTIFTPNSQELDRKVESSATQAPSQVVAESLSNSISPVLSSEKQEQSVHSQTASNHKPTFDAQRRYKRPVWATSLNAEREEDYIPADVAKEMIAAKAEETIYTDPRELEKKVSAEQEKAAFLKQVSQTEALSGQPEEGKEAAENQSDAIALAAAAASQEALQKHQKNKKHKASHKGKSKKAPEVQEEPISRSSRNQKRKKNNRRAGRLATYIIAFFLVLLALGGFFGYRYVSQAVGAKDASSTKFVSVEIPENSGSSYIGQLLESAGVIKSGKVFNYYTKFKNISNLQSGYYNLQASMTMDEIIEALQKKGSDVPQEPSLGTVLVKEGYTIDQIASAIEVNSSAKKGKFNKTGFKADDFLKVIKDEAFITKMKEKYPTLLANLPDSQQAKYVLEGYLFPATYDVHEETTAESLAEQMIATMDSYLSPYYSGIASSGYNVNEILTLASLVEKEGATDDDRKNIASVFYNRLNADMPLQSNIAILYALGKLGQETTLKEDATIDTKIDSPYNIYVHTGLMPGPVDSPSLSAIEAVVNPSSTKYMYFVADVTTGNVYFAEDYDEHQKNVETYINSKLKEN